MVLPILTDVTNTTSIVYTTSPDLMVFAPTLIIIGFWLLFLYMAETRKDIGYALFMMALSAFTFNDTVLSSISANSGEISGNLPLLMVFVSSYEVIMTFLLMRELNNRKKNGDEG